MEPPKRKIVNPNLFPDVPVDPVPPPVGSGIFDYLTPQQYPSFMGQPQGYNDPVSPALAIQPPAPFAVPGDRNIGQEPFLPLPGADTQVTNNDPYSNSYGNNGVGNNGIGAPGSEGVGVSQNGTDIPPVSRVSSIPHPKYSDFVPPPNFSDYMTGKPPVYDEAGIQHATNKALPFAGGLALLSLLGGDAKGILPEFNAVYGGAKNAATAQADADYKLNSAAYNAQNATAEKRYESDVRGNGVMNANISKQDAIKERQYNSDVSNAQKEFNTATDAYTEKQKQAQQKAENAAKEARINSLSTLRSMVQLSRNQQLTPAQSASLMKAIGSLSKTDLEGEMQSMSPKDAEELRLRSLGIDYSHDDRVKSMNLRETMQGNMIDYMKGRDTAHNAILTKMQADRVDNWKRQNELRDKAITAHGKNSYSLARTFFTNAQKADDEYGKQTRLMSTMKDRVNKLYSNPGMVDVVRGVATLNPTGELAKSDLEKDIKNQEDKLLLLQNSHSDNLKRANDALDEVQRENGTKTQQDSDRERIQRGVEQAMGQQRAVNTVDPSRIFMAPQTSITDNGGGIYPGMPNLPEVKLPKKGQSVPFPSANKLKQSKGGIRFRPLTN